MTHRSFTPEQDQMLSREYVGGATYRQLARKYGGTDVSVRNAILRTGTTYDVKREAQQSPLIAKDEEAMTEALLLYREGYSVQKLAQKYRCRTKVVSDLLMEAGAELHPGGRAHPKFRSDEACLRVAMEYESGTGLRAIAKRYHCTLPAVRRAITRAGVELRPGGRSQFWTPERVQYAVDQYQSGRSQQNIAAELGVSQGSVSNRLRGAGVLTRSEGKRREDHWAWKGGCVLAPGGYFAVLVSTDDLPFCTPNSVGYALEHRLVMGRSLGRPLTDDETVHHINGDRLDNRLENLQLRQGRHGNGVVMACKSCGSHDIEAVEIAT